MSRLDRACEEWRAAVADRAVGRASAVDGRLLDHHLEHCTGCRAALEDDTTPAPVLHVAPEMPDLSQRITQLNAAADRASTGSIARWLLAVVAAEVVVLSLRDLVFTDEIGSAAHAVRHAGSFSLAYGVMLVLVVVRPARARTVLPVSAVVAGALAITAVVDLVQGKIPLIGEALHIPEIISVLLVWLIAVPVGDRRLPWRKEPAPGLHAVDD